MVGARQILPHECPCCANPGSTTATASRIVRAGDARYCIIMDAAGSTTLEHG